MFRLFGKQAMLKQSPSIQKYIFHYRNICVFYTHVSTMLLLCFILLCVAYTHIYICMYRCVYEWYTHFPTTIPISLYDVSKIKILSLYRAQIWRIWELKPQVCQYMVRLIRCEYFLRNFCAIFWQIYCDNTNESFSKINKIFFHRFYQ